MAFYISVFYVYAIILLIMMVLLSTVIKQRMEKEVDEVGKIARFVKSKIEELDREVRW